MEPPGIGSPPSTRGLNETISENGLRALTAFPIASSAASSSILSSFSFITGVAATSAGKIPIGTTSRSVRLRLPAGPVCSEMSGTEKVSELTGTV